MKKTYILFLITSILTINFGCKKDNDNEANLIGRWDLQKLKIIIYENNKLKTSNDETTDLDILYFVFKVNGRLEIHAQDEDTEEALYTYTNNTITVTTADGEKNLWPVKIQGNTLILTEEETEVQGKVTYRIVTELHFKK